MRKAGLSLALVLFLSGMAWADAKFDDTAITFSVFYIKLLT